MFRQAMFEKPESYPTKKLPDTQTLLPRNFQIHRHCFNVNPDTQTLLQCKS